MKKTACSRVFGLALLACVAVPAFAAEPVTIDNFRRAETHHYFKTYVDKGCFGKLCNDRSPPPAWPDARCKSRHPINFTTGSTPSSQDVLSKMHLTGQTGSWRTR